MLGLPRAWLMLNVSLAGVACSSVWSVPIPIPSPLQLKQLVTLSTEPQALTSESLAPTRTKQLSVLTFSLKLSTPLLSSLFLSLALPSHYPPSTQRISRHPNTLTILPRLSKRVRLSQHSACFDLLVRRFPSASPNPGLCCWTRP